MKEDKITKRIKELQKDPKFTFKLTEDIINSVYRIAVEDLALEKKDPDKAYKIKDTIVGSSKEMNKRFGSKHSYEDYDKEQTIIFKAKQEAYTDVLKYMDNTNDLLKSYMYVKEMAKKTKYDEVQIV